MIGEPTERLLETLVGESKPVRRIPRLRVALAGVFGLGAVVAAFAVWHAGGLREDLVGVAACNARFDAVGVGLLGIALGGVVAALAQGIPGREHTARGAFYTLLISGGIAVGLGVLIHLFLEGPYSLSTISPLRGSLSCFSTSVVLSITPLATFAVVARKGILRHPFAVSLCAAAGGVGFGAFVVHLCCGIDSFFHVFFAHALAPFLGALLIGPILLLSLRARSDGH